jgi:hypothetical protein
MVLGTILHPKWLRRALLSVTLSKSARSSELLPHFVQMEPPCCICRCVINTETTSSACWNARETAQASILKEWHACTFSLVQDQYGKISLKEMHRGHEENHMSSRDLQIRMRRPLVGNDGPWGPGNSNSTYNLSCRWGRRGGRAPAFCVSEDACSHA